jgi:tight adherence protein C
MIYLIAFLFSASTALVIYALSQLVPSRTSGLAKRLAQLDGHEQNPFSPVQRRNRQARRDRWEAVLQTLGERVSAEETEFSPLRRRMIQAGFQNPKAPMIFSGVRVMIPAAFAILGLLFLPAMGALGLVLIAWLAGLGWIGPSFWIDARVKKRQFEVQKALADAIDLMVTCVEAGLGINQTLVRVAEEIRYVSTTLSQELTLVNLEIRAGRPRDEAFRNMAERTGVEDVRELMTMLIQTERFGTSVSHALRIHAETLRIKRRQRAEEAAAKTSIKILFPVLLCIFPSLFVVIIGPAAIRIYENLVNGVFGG